MADYGIPRVSGYRFNNLNSQGYSIGAYQEPNARQTPIRVSNLGANDNLGYSVAISGNYAIAGAPYEDGSSTSASFNCGAAYIFESDGSGNWAEKQILRANNLDGTDQFGISVAISGTYAIVGANQEDGTNNTTDCGAAYIFERDGSGNWIQKTILRASNFGGTDTFGQSVAISGNYAIVGANQEDGSSNQFTNSGAAYIFERISGTWTAKGILRASNLESNDNFGQAVAISGNYAIVGAHQEDGSSTDTGFNSGAAYIFERDDSGNWNQTAILRASNADGGDLFGWSVAISGNYAIVGAYQEDASSTSATFDSGAAYIFERNASGNWNPNGILRASNLESSDRFGYSVAINGNHALVGATYEDDYYPSGWNSGAVYIYYRNETTNIWTEQALYRAYNSDQNDNYGYSVAISNNQIIVGAPYEENSGTNPVNAGSAYFYYVNYPIYAYDPTPVSFVGNTLTITNTISNNDIDPVSFTLNSGVTLDQLRITDLSGGVYTYLSYTLKNATTGETIRSGNSINTVGYDLLLGTPLAASGTTTYNLTLTSYDTFTYTIVGSLDYGTPKISWTSPTETILRASNFGQTDQFGNSVAIDGNYAIVGALQEDGVNNTTDCGAAYIFECDNSGNFTEKKILRASNFGITDYFGVSVAISGNYAIVGAYGEAGLSNATAGSGAAYIFERDNSGNWIEKPILRASNLGGTDYFGVSVAISGNYAIVGAYQEDGSDNTNDCGGAYIFERNVSGNWTEKQILRASNLGGTDNFGRVVAISGNYAIVGANNEDGTSISATTNECGAAYIFERDGSGSWTEKKILRASNLGQGDQFGYSVAISGNYAIVGAYAEDGTNISATINSGAAYIFERDNSGNWTETKILRASNFGGNDYFGYSVSISGNYAIVGANYEDGTSISATTNDCGAAYIFERDISGNWTEKKILRASNIGANDQFGYSVAISGNYAIVGSYQEDGTNTSVNFDCGAAYIYKGEYGIDPTPLSFVNNTLTISSNIDATDIDMVSFQLSSGASLYPFSVTSFSGTGTVTYTLDISGGANVKTGTFSANNFDILTGTALTATGNTTYILRLTANAAINYTIVGNLLTSPTNIVLSNNSINELQPIGTTIGTLTCDNPNNSSITYSVNDTTRFSITGSTLKSNVIFDFETTSSYAVTITAAIGGLSSSRSITILVTNISGEAAELRRQNLQGPALKTAADSQSTPITATELKAAGYNATELKAAVYSATQLKSASFSATELKEASFSATELKAANYSATELKAANYSAVELKAAAFTLDELITAQYTAENLRSAAYTVAELTAKNFSFASLKSAGYTATEMKSSYLLADLISGGYNATELKAAAFTATELKAAGVSLADLISGGYNATELKAAAYTATELKAAGFSLANLISGGYNATELKAAAYTATELKAGGFNATQLKEGGYSATELKEALFNATELKAGGYNATQLKEALFTATELKAGGFNAIELKAGGYDATQLKEALFTATELKAGGYNATQLKEALFTATQLKEALFNATQLKEALFTATELKAAEFTATELKTGGYSATDLKAAAFTATELKAGGFNATELKVGGYNATELKVGGYNAAELKAAAFTATDLKAGGFSATELKAAEFTATELKAGGYDATEMKAGGFSATELKAGGYSATELKAGGFTATELKAGGFNATELKAAAFTATELKAGGYSATELKTAAFTATELKEALFTATQLKEALFTATQLKEALFTATQLKAGGYSATELKAAAFTATELKAAAFTATELNAGGYSATELKAAAYTAAEMKSSYTLAQLVSGGYTATELRAAEYTVAEMISSFSLAQLKDGGYTAAEMKSSFSLDELIAGQYNATELKAAAFTVAELTSKGFSLASLKSAGYTADEMKTSFSLDQLVSGGYTATELKAAAFTVAELTSKGFSLASLKVGGYTVAEMVSTFSLAQLKVGGYTVAEMVSTFSLAQLKTGGYTVAEMVSSFSLAQLKVGGYTVAEMVSKFSFEQLKTGGYTATEMKTIFSLTQLINGGYDATDLKAAAYSAADLKSRFSLEQLKTAGYTAAQMKAANFSLAQLKTGGYTVAEMTSSYTLAELKAGGYTATEMRSVYSLDQLIDGLYTVAELKAASYTVADLTSRFSLAQLKAGGYTANEMKLSYSLDQLIAGGYNATELKAAAFTVAELIAKNFSLEELKAGGYTATEMKSSFTLDQLIGGGYNATELRAAAFTVAELTAKGFPLASLKAGGYTVTEMSSVYSFAQLKSGGYTAAEMKLNYTLDELIAGGYNATELRSAAYTVAELTGKGFSFAALKAGGYTATEMKLSFSLDELISGGYNATELRAASYTVADLTGKGFVLASLKSGGYTVAEMTPTFSLAQLKAGGYTATEMKAANVSLADLKTLGYNAAELKAAEFTATQLKNATFTIGELKTGGYSAAEMKTALYSATQLKTVGYSATQMKDALYSATELYSVGYTSLQLVDGGFNASSLIILGIGPDWNLIENANCITTSYVQDFVDVSGSIVLRENANLYVNGNAEIGGNVALNRLVVNADANFGRSIFVGGDVSMNGKLTVRGDLSMNGSVTKCNLNNSSIPKSAFASAVPDGPDYTTSKIVYGQKFQSNADVSMNGATFAANNVILSGNIVFGDGTVMNAYDNNISTTNPPALKPSTFTRLDICGNLVAGSYVSLSDYRIKTNIVELDETYNVDKLRPVKYYQTQINREKYGLIAHELQEHYPDLVIGEKDGAELQRVNYMGLIAILINEIKRMKRELTELENDDVVGR